MFYDDDPDPYDRGRYQQQRRDPRRRRSSPSLIDAIADRPHRTTTRRTQSNWAPPRPSRPREYDHDPRPRPSRINYDDDDNDDDVWVMPDRYGPRTRARDSAPHGHDSSWQRLSRRRQYDDDDDDSRVWDDSRSIRNNPPHRPTRYREYDQELPPRKRPPERRPAPVQTQSIPQRDKRRAHDDYSEQDTGVSESDALSVFAHIRTDSDSGSSGNRDNFDDDQDDDDPESVRSPTPVRAPPKLKPKAKSKRKQAPPPQKPEIKAGSGSSFTMGSSQVSLEIEAIPPPGPQVTATVSNAFTAMLWTVDHLDRFSLILSIVLSLVVVGALIAATVAHESSLFVVVGVYAILWFLIYRESRALQDQVRVVHDNHVGMDALQLAEIDMIGLARRTIQATASKLMRIVQVSSGGSVIFIVLLAGLAIWSETWTSLGIAVVIMVMSGAAAAMASVQYGAIISSTDRIISEGNA